jgi:hypothetical protein
MDNTLTLKFTEAIRLVNNTDDMDGIYALLKDRTNELNRKAAMDFHVGQEVNFIDNKGRRWTGAVDNINREGRVKVKVVNTRYDSYTCGAQTLQRYVGKHLLHAKG